MFRLEGNPRQERRTTRAEDAHGTPTQSDISPSILVYEDKQALLLQHLGIWYSRCGIGVRYPEVQPCDCLRADWLRTRATKCLSSGTWAYVIRALALEYAILSLSFSLSHTLTYTHTHTHTHTHTLTHSLSPGHKERGGDQALLVRRRLPGKRSHLLLHIENRGVLRASHRQHLPCVWRGAYLRQSSIEMASSQQIYYTDALLLLTW